MELVSVRINVPKGMVPWINEADSKQEFERNAMMLYPYIQNATMSHGRAAELLGVSKLDLIDFYGGMGLPYIRVTNQELDEELSAYQAFKARTEK